MAEFVTTQLLDAPTVAEGNAGSPRRVAVLRFARPPMNMITAQVAREFAAAVDALAADRTVAAVVVYGDERVFSAGDDMAELADLDPDRAAAMAADVQRDLGCLGRLPQPTVAAISGYCLGGGLSLALGADRRIVGDNVKLGLPQILAGLIPLSGMRNLGETVGLGAAKDLVYSGRFVAADEAHTMGLVDEVVAPDDVYDAAVRWAERCATAPTMALAAAKAVFAAHDDPDAVARTQWSSLFATADRALGTRSYLANGPGTATFTGS